MTQNGSLTPKQQQFLLALLSGQGVEESAKSAKISSRTAYRWKELDIFQKELEQAKQATFDKQLLLLRDGVPTALKTLLRNMSSERVPPAVQVKAAAIWLSSAIQVHKTEALEDALAEVEHLLQEGGFSRVSSY